MLELKNILNYNHHYSFNAGYLMQVTLQSATWMNFQPKAGAGLNIQTAGVTDGTE